MGALHNILNIIFSVVGEFPELSPKPENWHKLHAMYNGFRRQAYFYLLVIDISFSLDKKAEQQLPRIIPCLVIEDL